MHPAPRTMHLGQGQNTLVIAESARFQDRGECLEEVRGLTASSGSLKETQTHGDKRRTTHCAVLLPSSISMSEEPSCCPRQIFVAISEFPKWRKYLISLSFRGQSSVRPVQVGGFDVNIVIHRSTAVRGRGGPARHDAWPPSLGAILAHTDGPCGS